jgi:3-dehydroquinate dehydratase I
MICVAISDKNLQNCLETLQQVEMAEIRLDLTGFDDNAIKKVFATAIPLIATCRPDNVGKEEQYRQLKIAIESGAKYVDIELETNKKQRKRIIETAQKNKCDIIISYHNFESTPGIKELNKKVSACYMFGADLAKIAVQVNSHEDNARILSLYNTKRRIVAIGMGELGKMTRVLAPLLGAEFTFAAMDSGLATAPGQIPYSILKSAVDKLKKLK